MVKKLDHILIKVKVQIIYFQTDENSLGQEYATSEKRITIAEAENILLDRDIHYKEVLKVKYEYVETEIPLTDFKNYII